MAGGCAEVERGLLVPTEAPWRNEEAPWRDQENYHKTTWRDGSVPEEDNAQEDDFDVNAHDEALRRTHARTRLVLLVATCAQTTVDVLLRSYSRRTLGESYSASSVLLIAELMKLAFSLAMMGVDVMRC